MDETRPMGLQPPETMTPEALAAGLRLSIAQRRKLQAALTSQDPEFWSDKGYDESSFAEALLSFIRRPGGLAIYTRVACQIQKKKKPLVIGPAFFRSVTDDLFRDKDFMAVWPSICGKEGTPIEVVKYLISHDQANLAANLAWAIAPQFRKQIDSLCEDCSELAKLIGEAVESYDHASVAQLRGELIESDESEGFDWPSSLVRLKSLVDQLSPDVVEYRLASDIAEIASSMSKHAAAHSKLEASRLRAEETLARCVNALALLSVETNEFQAKSFVDRCKMDLELCVECEGLASKLVVAHEEHLKAKEDANPLNDSSLDAWRAAAREEKALLDRLMAQFQGMKDEIPDFTDGGQEGPEPQEQSSHDTENPLPLFEQALNPASQIDDSEPNGAPAFEAKINGPAPPDEAPREMQVNDAEEPELVLSPEYWLESHLRSERLSEAYWLGWSLEQAGERAALPCSLLGASYVGRFQAPGEPTGPELRTFLEAAMGLSLNPTEAALASAAILPVALFSPQPPEGAFTLISNLTTEVSGLDALVAEVRASCIHQGKYLVWSTIKETDAEVEYEAALQRLRTAAKEYLNHVPHYTINWRPAADAFREAFREGQPMRRALKAVRDNDEHEFPWVERFMEDFWWDTALSETPTGSKFLHQIQGAARQRLHNLISEFSSIVDGWVTLKNRSDELQRAKNRHDLSSIRSGILKRLPDVISEVCSLAEEPGLRGAVLSAVGARLRELQRTLQDGVLPTWESLNEPLLTLTAIRLNPDLSLLDNPTEVQALKLALQTETTSKDYNAIVSVLLERGEFARAIALTEKAADSKLRSQVDTEIDKSIDKTRQIIEDAENDVEDAYLLGLLSGVSGPSIPVEGDSGPVRSELLAQLHDARKALAENERSPSPANLGRALMTASTVRDHIQALKRERQRIFSDQLEGIARELRLGGSEDQQDADYLTEQQAFFVKHDDLIALAELASQADAARRARTRIDRFMTDALEHRLADFLGKSEKLGRFWNQALRVATLVEQQLQVGPVSFGDKDTAYCHRAASAIRSWDQLTVPSGIKNAITPELKQNLLNVLQFLGFPVSPSTEVVIENLEQSFLHVRIPVSEAISISAIPAFGSALLPMIELVVCPAKVQPRSLAEFLNRKKLNRKSVLVIYKPELTNNQRLEFRGHASRNQLSALLVDFSLFLYSVASRDPLPTLLDLGMPFLWSQPYHKKGPLVPKELFVGRQREAREVTEPSGTSIVYGGRQLGKSALLQHVRAERHKPAKGSFAAYVDIYNLGVSEATEKMETEFWSAVGEELRHATFLEPGDCEPKKGESRGNAIRRAIRERLAKNTSDRLILLLDEADNLLDADASQHFRVTKQLRELMDQTNHRCKVVFAGLQSVQRFYNYKNHPFAQLGSGVQIAPLPPSAARALVIEPLRALGFEFASRRLVYRILSHSNYHPGLVQIFCHRLLERLYQEKGADRSPVRQIDSQDVGAIERDREFQREIRDRFDWTLDLDDRYKVLIYALVISDDHEPTGALTERDFLELGRFWWPPVFEDMDHQAARSLLDELVGLGVLASVVDGDIQRFRLRNPNLLRLLGPKPDLEAELSRLISRSTIRRSNPRHFRRPLDKKAVRFSPLDNEQSAQLVRVDRPLKIAIIRGSVPLGISAVHQHIHELLGELAEHGEKWEQIPIPSGAVVSGSDRLEAFLVAKLKTQNRPDRYAVIDTCGLDSSASISSLVRGLIERLSPLCRKTSRGLIILLVDSASIWQCLHDTQIERMLEDERVSQINLKRWSDGALARALEDLDLRTRAKDLGESIFHHTQGIHYLCEEILRAATSNNGALTDKGLTALIDKLRDDTHLQVTTGSPALATAVDRLQALVGERREDWRAAIKLLEEENHSDLAAHLLDRVLEDGGHRFRTWLREAGFTGPQQEDGYFQISPLLKAVP